MRKLTMPELGRLSVEQYQKAKKIPVVLVLDNIRSGFNVGSVFRTGDAFRIEKIYLCGITAKPPNKEINKTALGATNSVDWTYFPSTQQAISLLKQQGYKLIAVEQVTNSVKLHEFNPQNLDKTAFVFGNEVKGIDQKIIDMCDIGLEIPQFGTKHSLNISVSVGIILWDFVQKQNLINRILTK
jgi:tRNA G18 (ribose-2'-O)-methylase SpoU